MSIAQYVAQLEEKERKKKSALEEKEHRKTEGEEKKQQKEEEQRQKAKEREKKAEQQAKKAKKASDEKSRKVTCKTSNKGGECSHSKNSIGKNTVKNLVPNPVSIPMCAVCALGCIRKVWSVVTDMTGLSVPVADGVCGSF